jgi:uncharacterized membrane protein YdjX (TVP38/TMEM64 family)
MLNNDRLTTYWARGAALAGMALITGCASLNSGVSGLMGSGTGVTATDPTRLTQSGFLSDYARLKPTPWGEGIQCWADPRLDAKRYDKVLIAPMVVTLGVAVLVAAGFPRLLFCGIAGMALGFWHGLVWAQLGTLIGNYIVFLLVRAGAGEWGRRYLSSHGGFKLIESEGIAAVLLARQLPVPGLLVNLAFGLSKLKHRHFLIGTALGQLPEAIPCTLIGAGAIQSSFGKSAGIVGLSVLVLAAMWIGLRIAMRRFRRKKDII